MITQSRHDDVAYLKKLEKAGEPIEDERLLFGKPLAVTQLVDDADEQPKDQGADDGKKGSTPSEASDAADGDQPPELLAADAKPEVEATG